MGQFSSANNIITALSLCGPCRPVEYKSRWPRGQIQWPLANGPVLMTSLNSILFEDLWSMEISPCTHHPLESVISNWNYEYHPQSKCLTFSHLTSYLNHLSPLQGYFSSSPSLEIRIGLGGQCSGDEDGDKLSLSHLEHKFLNFFVFCGDIWYIRDTGIIFNIRLTDRACVIQKNFFLLWRCMGHIDLQFHWSYKNKHHFEWYFL